MLENAYDYCDQDFIEALESLEHNIDFANVSYEVSSGWRKTLFEAAYGSFSHWNQNSHCSWLKRMKWVTNLLMEKGCRLDQLSIRTLPTDQVQWNLLCSIIIDFSYVQFLQGTFLGKQQLMDYLKYILVFNRCDANKICMYDNTDPTTLTPFEAALFFGSVDCLPAFLEAGADGTKVHLSWWLCKIFEEYPPMFDNHIERMRNIETRRQGPVYTFDILRLLHESGIEFYNLILKEVGREDTGDRDGNLAIFFDKRNYFINRGHPLGEENEKIPATKIDEMKVWIKEALSKPRSLKSLARIKLRHICAEQKIKLHTWILEITKQHEIPLEVSEYLCLKR